MRLSSNLQQLPIYRKYRGHHGDIITKTQDPGTPGKDNNQTSLMNHLKGG